MAVVASPMEFSRCTTTRVNRFSACRSKTARHQGLVKHVDRSKGFGFIQCDEIFQRYGTDVFVRMLDLLDHGVGDAVCFSLNESKHGQPQASQVKLIDEAPQSKSSDEFRESDKKDIECKMSGVVKSFDGGKGYGFISCAETFEKYGRDVFAHKDQLQSFQVGDQVSFNVKAGVAGNPQAINVTYKLPSLNWLGTSEVLQSASEDKHGKLVSLNDVPLSGKKQGKVKSINVAKACGFIECEALHKQCGRDVFFPLSLLAGLNIGDHVEFESRLRNGQPQAISLCLADSPSQRGARCDEQPVRNRELPHTSDVDGADQHVREQTSSDPSLSSKHIGKVKIINEAKACGFIECEALHKQFGRDVFFPLALLSGLKVGDFVEFQSRLKNGQPQANSLSRVDLPSLSNAESKAKDIASQEKTKLLLRACASSGKDSYNRMFELLHQGADPNGRDVTGQTALMVAAFNAGGSEKKCRLLVGMGADVHSIYKGDLTVLQWARERISHKFASHLQALSKGEQVDCMISLHNMGGPSEV